MNLKNRHRTIRMSPNEVNLHNEQHLLNTVYNYKWLMTSSSAAKEADSVPGALRRRRAKYKVGDHVRISEQRLIFDKAYDPNWTPEIFQIKKVQYHTNPITYLIDDYRDEILDGCFYDEELQPVKHLNVYLIEKEIRKRNGKVYIKWLGFGPEHNSWVPEKDVL